MVKKEAGGVFIFPTSVTWSLNAPTYPEYSKDSPVYGHFQGLVCTNWLPLLSHTFHVITKVALTFSSCASWVSAYSIGLSCSWRSWWCPDTFMELSMISDLGTMVSLGPVNTFPMVSKVLEDLLHCRASPWYPLFPDQDWFYDKNRGVRSQIRNKMTYRDKFYTWSSWCYHYSTHPYHRRLQTPSPLVLRIVGYKLTVPSTSV